MSPQAEKNDEKLMPAIVAQLLRPAEAAAILGIRPKTVHKLVREGKLPCVQVTARERRFTPEQVQEYIASQSTGVRVDKNDPKPVLSRPKKGGAKSSGVSGTGLAKEIRSLCQS